MRIAKRSAGFTLIELMIVIAILAILIAIGVPSFTSLIKNNRLTSAANDLAGALHFARAEAVRRGSSVQVSSVSDNIGNGVRVWFDADGDGNLDSGADSSEELRLVRMAAPAVSVAADTGANVSLTFSARGRASGAVILSICDDRSGNYGKEVSLLATGVMRTKSGIACGGG
ncbi:type IV fimbrial biogenesis protein FimT [Microbulbifer marinus]|uniref:Type II secretion system protein H n=2 Tax=Microbulbifer marinus TaxID=658218 RepID=A0A1H4BIL4_9GAMM|nr:type IV fimbrial biogenesis protein FimT [Microbulbifer marinus]